MEGLAVMSIVVLLFKNKFEGFKNSIGIVLLIWLAYNLMELVNPFALSVMAWFYAVRGIILMILLFFIAYSTIRTKKQIYTVYGVLLGFGFIGALYGLKQQYLGPFDYEVAWLQESEIRMQFFYAWGRLRIFSIFSDPKDFGLFMAFIAVMALVLAFNKKLNEIKKAILLLIFVLSAWAMIFSGIRTSTVLILIGIAIFIVIDLRKKMVVFSVFLGGVMLVLVFFSNRIDALYIMSTAFKGKEDASFNVRLENQKFVRKYVLQAPIGYGIGTTGEWGSQFSSGHVLNGFPPDSEFVRIGVENGWLGMLYWSFLLGYIFMTGVKTFFRLQDGELKNILLASLVVYMMFVISMYPQESLRTYTLITFFAILVAIIAKISFSKVS